MDLRHKHLLLKTKNENLDLRTISQFRYIRAKLRMRKELQKQTPRRMSDMGVRVALPPVAHKRTPSELLSSTIVKDTKKLTEVSLSYSRILTSFRSSPVLSPNRSATFPLFSPKSQSNVSLDLLREKLKSKQQG